MHKHLKMPYTNFKNKRQGGLKNGEMLRNERKIESSAGFSLLWKSYASVTWLSVLLTDVSTLPLCPTLSCRINIDFFFEMRELHSWV